MRIASETPAGPVVAGALRLRAAMVRSTMRRVAGGHSDWSEPLSENDTMAVDAKRVQAVFMAALEAADPVQQAAILDRECASDTEMRQRVEALLRAYREPATILDPANGDPLRGRSTLAGQHDGV